MLARVRTKLNADEAFLAGLLHEVGKLYIAEPSEEACVDPEFHSRAPRFGSLAMDNATFDWLVRAADIDVRLMTIAFGV